MNNQKTLEMLNNRVCDTLIHTMKKANIEKVTVTYEEFSKSDNQNEAKIDIKENGDLTFSYVSKSPLNLCQ
jgi:hypothetical protein